MFNLIWTRCLGSLESMTLQETIANLVCCDILLCFSAMATQFVCVCGGGGGGWGGVCVCGGGGGWVVVVLLLLFGAFFQTGRRKQCKER